MSLAALTQAVEANLTAFHVVPGERFYAHYSHEEVFGLFCEYEMARYRALRGTIMKKQSTSIVLGVVVLMAACAPIQRGRSYQESVVGGFELKEWTVGRQRSDQNQRIVEFVRPGEKMSHDNANLRLLPQLSAAARSERYR